MNAHNRHRPAGFTLIARENPPLRIAAEPIIHKLQQYDGIAPLKRMEKAGSTEVMSSSHVKILNALSQANRLALFEAIASAEDGLTTTEAAEAAGTLLNTAAVNLKVLEAAGLITSIKRGRAVNHTARLEGVRALAAHLHAIGAK